MSKSEIILACFAVWNVLVFLIYALDKYKAVRNQWRIPEKTLIVLAFAAGGPGALLGMYVIRHKTRAPKFRILVPLAVVIQAVAVVAVL